MRTEPGLSRWTRVLLEELVMRPERRRGNVQSLRRSTAADRLGITQRAVQRAFRQAEDSGWIVRHGRANNGQPQCWHRSTPWDSFLYWDRTCDECRRANRDPGGGRETWCLPERLPERLPSVRDRARSLVVVHSQHGGFRDLVEQILSRMLVDEKLGAAA
jgi:DNA-binding transcriptional MocR family regulator